MVDLHRASMGTALLVLETVLLPARQNGLRESCWHCPGGDHGMKMNKNYIFDISKDPKKLSALRRNIRKQFKDNTNGDPSFKMWLMINPHISQRNVQRVRIILRISKVMGDMKVEYSAQVWLTSYAKEEEATINETVLVSPKSYGHISSFAFDPCMEAIRGYGLDALALLSGDPIAALRMAVTSRKMRQ